MRIWLILAEISGDILGVCQTGVGKPCFRYRRHHPPPLQANLHHNMDFHPNFPLNLRLCSVSLIKSKCTEANLWIPTKQHLDLSGTWRSKIDILTRLCRGSLPPQTKALFQIRVHLEIQRGCWILQPNSDWFVFPFLIKDTELCTVERNSLPSTTRKNYTVSVVFLFDSIKHSARANCAYDVSWAWSPQWTSMSRRFKPWLPSVLMLPVEGPELLRKPCTWESIASEPSARAGPLVDGGDELPNRSSGHPDLISGLGQPAESVLLFIKKTLDWQIQEARENSPCLFVILTDSVNYT